MKIIPVKDVIGTPNASSKELAPKVYQLISESIDQKEKVIIDFSNIKTLTTAFVNVAIGQLYTKYAKSVLNEYILFNANELTETQRSKITEVMKNTKSKLSQDKIDEVTLHG